MKRISKFFSVGSITEKLLLLVSRFPISILLIIGFSVLLFEKISGNIYNLPYQLFFFFAIGIFISVTVTLFFEDYVSNLKNYGITFAVILIWGVYNFFLPKNINDIKTDKIIELIVIGGTAFFAMFFISFLKKNKTREFWNFTTKILFQMLLTVVFGAILFGGLSLALFAIDSLFDFSINDKLYVNLAVLCFALFSPLYFLANIPDKIRKQDSDILYNKVQKILALYIMSPILAVYAVILYAYMFKILITWELPNGWVSWLVSAFALGGLIVIMLLYPIREYEKNKIENFISRWLSLLVLPLLLLMTIGIVRRINDYGITINRCYILLLNLWFYGIYIYLFLTKSRNIKWILISPIAIALLTSINLWGVANITKKSLSKEITNVLKAQVSFEEAKAIFNTLTIEEQERMKSTIRYLYKNFGKASVQAYFTDTLSSDYWSVVYDLGLNGYDIPDAEYTEKRDRISYYAESKKIWQIEEIKSYQNFTKIEYYSYYDKEDEITSEGEKIIIKVSVDNRNFYIPMREFVLEYLSTDEDLQNEKNWIIKGNEYTLLISSFTGDYYPEKDSINIDNFKGYLLYK